MSAKPTRSDSGDSPVNRPGNLYIPSSSLGLAGLPYDVPSAPSPVSGRSTPLKGRRSSIGTSNRKLGSEFGDAVYDRRDNCRAKGHFNEGSTESKHRFYQHPSQWDDFDDPSPSLHSVSQIPSQAVALVEDGRGCIVDISSNKFSLDQIEVPDGTTHLLLAKTHLPLAVGTLLSARLPVIAANLVVLDISDVGLNSLPSAIALCDALEELNVSGNVMINGELPSFLSHLTSLKVLAADRCGLYQIAHYYGTLINLRDLSVCRNHLKSLPSWLSQLNRLEILLVDGNDFEPPWLELVEPLLFSHHRPSGQIPEPPRTAPMALDEPRRNLNSDHSVNGQRHLRGPDHTLTTSLGYTHGDQAEDRPSSLSSEASLNPQSPNSAKFRRLRSTSEMRSAPPSRPTSAHDQFTAPLVLPMEPHSGDVSPEASASFRPSSSPSQRHRRPSTASGAAIGHRISTEPQENCQHLNSGSQHHRSDTPSGEAPQISSNYGPSNSIPSRENTKKSFGFLKKMSLGKLRREPNRTRTASIDTFGRPVYNSLYSKSSSNPGSELNPMDLSSKLSLSDGLTPQECDESSEIDDLPSRTLNGPKSADSHPTSSNAKTRLNNRRSFLKLGDHLAPLNLASPSKSLDPISDQANFGKSTNKKLTHSSSGSQKSESGDFREADVQVGHALTQPPGISKHWASLRSIMMYLRDVHDLSGDVARVPGGGPVSGSTRAMPSSSISRASSTKQGPPTSSMNALVFADGRNALVPPLPTGAADLDPDNLDNHLSNGNMPASSIVSETPGSMKVKDNAIRRFKVLEEIVATEKSYIKGLKELYDIYITSASSMVSSSIGKEKEPMVPPAERKIVFNNVEAIIGFHVDVLLPDFQEVMDRLRQKQTGIATPDSSELAGPNANEISSKRQEIEGQLTSIAAEELARVFIRHAAFLKLYATYITQFDSALERLREWSVTSPVAATSTPAWAPTSSTPSTNSANHHHNTLSGGQKKRLKTYMKRCRAHGSHTQMNLESYLLMPVQRLPRYKLLLESLVSCTPELNHGSDHDDEFIEHEWEGDQKRPKLIPSRVATEALNIVSAVTAEMNERKRDSEGRQRLLYWQQRFGNKFRSPLVQPHRTLIKEGTMVLMRTVKLTSKDSVVSGGGGSHPPVRIRVPVLNTDSQSVPMIVLLCTDLLVLVKDPGDGGRASNMASASLFQALRLAQHTRPQVNLPATVFGADQTMIRFVDNRAIFYFQCDCQRSAAAWMVAINQQVPLL